jgi:hypothetical protein
MNPDTPFTIAISKNEMIAIIKFHTAQVRALPKKVGAISMKLAAENVFPKTRELKALHDEAKDVMAYHTSRARGLLSLIDSDKKTGPEESR